MYKRQLLLLIPIILTFISGFKGDKAEHEEKREKERQAAVASGDLVLETDPCLLYTSALFTVS